MRLIGIPLTPWVFDNFGCEGGKGATWCHWCHVLDRTSLADPRVVRMLNDDYISIRVDTDRWLADHAAVATAYLDLHDATGKGEYLQWAEETLSDAVSRLYRPEAAGFLDRLPAAGDFGVLSQPLYPFAPNAHIASALLRCARATAREDLFAIGVRTLCGLSAEFDRRGAFAATYGSALLLYTKGNPGTACLPGDPTCV